MSDRQPVVRLVLQRPEGELRLTWVSPRSLGLNNGASREVLLQRAAEKGVDLRCPPGTAQRVAQMIASGQVTITTWAMARVSELPDGDTMQIRKIPGGASIAVSDTIGGTFCPANEWWIAVVRS